ncbi:hypothetical protein ACVWY3_004698 [Bradyrhizobium sp. USDA 4486]
MEMPERPICAASLYIKDAARNCRHGVSITTDRCTRPPPSKTERVINRPRSLKRYPSFATHKNHHSFQGRLIIACIRAKRIMSSETRQAVPGCGETNSLQTYYTGVRRLNKELNLCSLIDRKAAYAPDETAIHFEGPPLGYVSLNRRTDRIARAFNQLGVQGGRPDSDPQLQHADFSGAAMSMRKQRPILSRSRTAPTQASLSAQHGAASSTLLASRSLSDRAQMPGGRECRGS